MPDGCRPDRERPATLAALEGVYDGPIPEAALAAARLDRRGALLLMRARAEAAFFGGMVRGQLRALKQRTGDGSYYPALLDDLRLYRRHHRAWRRLAAQLAHGPEAVDRTESGSPAS